MTAIVLHEGWRDGQAASRYPFSDSSTLVASTGASLPQSAVLDAAVYPPGVGPFRVASALVTSGSIELRIAGAGRDTLATATFDPDDPPALLRLVTPAGRYAGVLVCDPTGLAALRGWALGNHEFRAGTADLVPAVCHPVPGDGLAGVAVGDEVVSGRLWLVGEHGVVFRVVTEPDGSKVIRYDVVGDPLFSRDGCEVETEEPEETGPRRYLKEFGGVGPDRYGGVTLTPYIDRDAFPPVRTSLRVTHTDNRIVVSLADAPVRGEGE